MDGRTTPEKAAGGARLARHSQLALSACALGLILLICGGLLAYLNGMIDSQSSFVIGALVCLAVGGAVASYHPANPVGWLFLGAALAVLLQGFAREWAIYALTTRPGTLPFGPMAASIAIWFGPLGAALMLIIVPLYFPEGRPVSPRWRPVVRLVALAAAADLLLYALLPNTSVYGTGISNPMGLEALRPVRGLIKNAGLVLWLGLILVAVTSLVVRFRRSRNDERQQLKWFMYAVAIVLFWFCTNWPLEKAIPDLFPVLDSLVVSSVPVAAGVAILRYRLYDIDLVINRTLLYAGLTACVVGLYVLVVGYLGALFQTGGNLAISLVATGLVALLFQPLRERLQQAVNRLTYGDRDDPYAVLSRLGRRLEGTLDPEAALATVTEAVAAALGLPYAAIELENREGLERAAEHGVPRGETVALALTHQSEEVGRLLVSPRTPGEGFSPQDEKLLGDLARQAGAVVHAARLSTDLRRSRERLVTAREEERRRLSRDLHDGLGPRLATLSLKEDAARNLLASDPGAADALLAELKGETKEAIADVRRVVNDLRPPALDQLGLVPALRQWAERWRLSGGPGVSLEAPEGGAMPPLPAATEVAAYRIAQEAVINALRHADASRCVVRLGPDEGETNLLVEVRDDGRGIGDVRGGDRKVRGFGLRSMRERAEELGGTFEAAPAPGGGTRVRAVLPLRPGSGPVEAGGEAP